MGKLNEYVVLESRQIPSWFNASKFFLFHLIQADLDSKLHSAHGVSLIWKILEFDNADLDTRIIYQLEPDQGFFF